MHRDITLHNIFISDKITLKVGNFGNARKLTNNDEFRYTVTDNTNFLSPEVLSGKGYQASEVDPWSLGVILYALLIGKLPFDHEYDVA